MRFYVLSNGISGMSGRSGDDNERLVQWKHVYGRKRLCLRRLSNPGGVGIESLGLEKWKRDKNLNTIEFSNCLLLVTGSKRFNDPREKTS